MKDDYTENLENGKRITEEICQILKDNDIQLYNRYIDSSDSFKWEFMTYLMFYIGELKSPEEAVKGFIAGYNNRGSTFVYDETELKCASTNFDIKGENNE